MKVDPISMAKTLLAATTLAESELMRCYYAGGARMAVVEVREELRLLELHLAAVEKEIERGAAPRGQLQIGGPK